MSAPELTFLAPPFSGDDHDGAAPDGWDRASPGHSPGFSARNGQPAPALRMTRGAREAATGMKIDDADIQRCLEVPDDVSPHPDTPSRTRFRRGTLVVLAGADGTVLRVGRRNR